MGRAFVIVAILLCGMQPAAADEPVVVVANLELHSAFWPNLHHLLYASAWARRPKTGSRRLSPDLPTPLPSTLSRDEQAIWDEAVGYYERVLANRDLLTGRGMEDIKTALAAEDLASNAVGVDLRSVLSRVAPIYRRHFWSVHDRSNREWIQNTVDRLRTIEAEIVREQSRLYGRPWFTAPVRVDVVWVG